MTRPRQDRLLALLVRDGEWVTAARLADLLGVTPRSTRSYVTALNARAAGVAVESGPLGYRVGPDAAAAEGASRSASAHSGRVDKSKFTAPL